MALQEGEKYGPSKKGKNGAIKRVVLGPRGKIIRWETVEEASTTAAGSAPETETAPPKPKRVPPAPKADAPPAEVPAARAHSDALDMTKVAKGLGIVAASGLMGYAIARLVRRAA